MKEKYLFYNKILFNFMEARVQGVREILRVKHRVSLVRQGSYIMWVLPLFQGNLVVKTGRNDWATDAAAPGNETLAGNTVSQMKSLKIFSRSLILYISFWKYDHCNRQGRTEAKIYQLLKIELFSCMKHAASPNEIFVNLPKIVDTLKYLTLEVIRGTA